MSTSVLVIPEDFRKDQYVLEPIINAMMRALGRPRAKVRICRVPLLGGISEALKQERIAEIINRYRGMVDLFLLCVDRDGKPDRRASLDFIERLAATLLTGNQKFFAENAWQEVEVWVLAGHTLPKDWSWKEIRDEINPKERYFEPLARQRNLLYEPGGGRKTLAQEAAGRYRRIHQLCEEDVAQLESRIQAWMQNSP
jgi:hypothetical protein